MQVEVPGPEDERLRFGRVGIIALVGFVIGMLWPKLAGVKLVPSAPVAEEQAVSQPVPSAGSVAVPSLPPPAVKPLPVEPVARQAPANSVTVSEPHVASCRDASGKRVRECDKIDVDRLARPRVMALAGCPAAADARGLLSLGLEFDFTANKIKEFLKGKSTTLESDKADAVLECAKRGFASAALDGIAHTGRAYTVFYRVEFLPSPKEAAVPAGADTDAGDAEVTLASGRATVIWEVAILRTSPTKDGEVAARVLRGTRLTVTGRQMDWYKVKYDAKGSEGWVFRTAIGL